eukprot:scaffold88443_cov46-Phaeocystis_antarctica.AAC.1
MEGPPAVWPAAGAEGRHQGEPERRPACELCLPALGSQLVARKGGGELPDGRVRKRRGHDVCGGDAARAHAHDDELLLVHLRLRLRRPRLCSHPAERACLPEQEGGRGEEEVARQPELLPEAVVLGRAALRPEEPQAVLPAPPHLGGDALQPSHRIVALLVAAHGHESDAHTAARRRCGGGAGAGAG